MSCEGTWINIFWQGSNVLQLNLLAFSKTAFLLMSKLFIFVFSHGAIRYTAMFYLGYSLGKIQLWWFWIFVWCCVRSSHIRESKFSLKIAAFEAVAVYPVVQTNQCSRWCEKVLLSLTKHDNIIKESHSTICAEWNPFIWNEIDVIHHNI